MTSKATKMRKSKLNSRVIKENDKKNKRELLSFFLICILISIPILLYLMNRIEYVRIEYEIKELKARKQVLQADQKYLEVEKATLEAPHSIEKKARKELSLISQDEGGYLVIVQLKPLPHEKETLIAEKHPAMYGEKNRKNLRIN